MVVALVAAIVNVARMKVMLTVLTAKLNVKFLLHLFVHDGVYLLLFLLNKSDIFKFSFFGPVFVHLNKILLLETPLKKLFLFHVVAFEVAAILLVDALH